MYSTFLSHCLKTAQRGGGSLWDPWAAYDEAVTPAEEEQAAYTVLLHRLYCHASPCTWDEEEEQDEVAPEALPHHLAWASFTDRLTEAGITLKDAFNYHDEICRLAGW